MNENIAFCTGNESADTLHDEIGATRARYQARGARATSATDTVLPATDLSEYLFEIKQMSDGAMLAWQPVILRSDLSESICSPAGAGGGSGGGPGGAGGDGGGPDGPRPGFDGGMPSG